MKIKNLVHVQVILEQHGYQQKKNKIYYIGGQIVIFKKSIKLDESQHE